MRAAARGGDVSPQTRYPPSSNDSIFETLEPFLVVAPWHRECLDRQPFGVAVPDDNVLDPTRVGTAEFLRRLIVLDRLTFGPEGMPMPKWLFYDSAEVPGAIFGFARRAEHLPAGIARRLELGERPTGLMPLSMYIAIPTRPPHAWFGHNLASLNRVLPELGLGGLASITKAMALKAFRCRCQLGAVQWRSPGLYVHTRFGALELITAWTPAHTDPATLTYQIQITDQRLRCGLGDPAATHPPRPTRPPRSAADFQVAADDITAMQELQARIEGGERFWIPGPPRRGDDGSISVPVTEAPPRQAG